MAAAGDRQTKRYAALGLDGARTNAACPPNLLDEVAKPDSGGARLVRDATEKMRLPARAFQRVLKVARTLTHLDGEDGVGRVHLAEALAWRERTF